MKKRKKLDQLDLFLDKTLLEMHKGTCKKVLMFQSKYEYVGRADKVMDFSGKLNDLIGVDLAKNIRKCKHCYPEG